MSDNLIVKFKTAVTVTVLETVIYSHNAPSSYENDYEGNGKFLRAFAKVSGNGYRSFFAITLTTKSETTGNTYRQKITAYDFVKMVAFELQSGVMEAFTKSMFQHDNGFEKDATKIVDDNTKEVYASFEAGTHYWRVMMADEQDKVMNRGEISSTVADSFDTDVSENK
jgi:hypothetical protein